MIRVTLSTEEMDLAYHFGCARQTFANLRGLSERYGQNGDPYPRHVLGVAGELAYAKYRGVYFVPSLHVQARGESDVGGDQVRTTGRPDGDLILHPDDDDGARFVLVTGTPPLMGIVGWVTAGEVKLGQWFLPKNGRPPAYWVPQSALNPFEVSPGGGSFALGKSTNGPPPGELVAYEPDGTPVYYSPSDDGRPF